MLLEMPSICRNPTMTGGNGRRSVLAALLKDMLIPSGLVYNFGEQVRYIIRSVWINLDLHSVHLQHLQRIDTMGAKADKSTRCGPIKHHVN
jgi:hypothetical protein